MADLESLGYKSISEMTPDEAIEHLRQIRLSRRVVKKATKKYTTKKAKKEKLPEVSADQAANLLKLLGGMKND